MQEANWFVVIDRFGNYSVGRTNIKCQANYSAIMPDGSIGKIIVAPNHFIVSFRENYLSKSSCSSQIILSKKLNLALYKLAIIKWEDRFRVSLLK